MRIAHVDAPAGIAGDMFLAALVDLGAPLERILELYAEVGLAGVNIRPKRVDRAGVQANYLEIDIEGGQWRRDIDQLFSYLTHHAVPKVVSRRAVRCLETIISAERQVHGLKEGEELHLHEIGSYDTAVDLLGVFYAIELLGIEEVSFSAIAVGSGWTRTDHGLLPNPTPLVSSILVGQRLTKCQAEMEMTTPTGATLVRELSKTERLVSARLLAVGYGAGTRNPDSYPNVLSILMTETDADGSDATAESVSVSEVYIDDMSGEEIGSIVDEAIAEGALDAWITPGLGKKSRPGHLLTVLWRYPASQGSLQWLHRRTGSPGMRIRDERRSVLERRFESVSVGGHQIRIKVTASGMKAEFEDLKVASQATGLTVREVSSLAVSAYLRRSGLDPER